MNATNYGNIGDIHLQSIAYITATIRYICV